MLHIRDLRRRFATLGKDIKNEERLERKFGLTSKEKPALLIEQEKINTQLRRKQQELAQRLADWNHNQHAKVGEVSAMWLTGSKVDPDTILAAAAEMRVAGGGDDLRAELLEWVW